MSGIYLDHNATTSLLPEVLEAMRPHLTAQPGNPASAHGAGREARRALEDARTQTAALLGAHADEVIFTSGATEANNLALFGLAGNRGAHLLSSPIEHPSVAEPLRQLSTAGFPLEFLPVDAAGLVSESSIPRQLRADTRLVCIQQVNHETGALQPIAEFARLLPAHVFLHCDAAQSAGKVPVHFRELGVTSLTLSGHKFHGPVGIGALLLRRGTRLAPRLFGGHQQQGHRPGTEPVALVVGLASALALAVRDMTQRREQVGRLRQRFLERLRDGAAPLVVNGPETERSSPYTLNVSFPGCQADALLMNLDLAGVACSTGSACSSGSLLPSPVLQAMGAREDVLKSAMRFSFSAFQGEAEIDEAARRIADIVRRLRLLHAENVN